MSTTHNLSTTNGEPQTKYRCSEVKGYFRTPQGKKVHFLINQNGIQTDEDQVSEPLLIQLQEFLIVGND